jgi:hypothetical protein
VPSLPGTHDEDDEGKILFDGKTNNNGGSAGFIVSSLFWPLTWATLKALSYNVEIARLRLLWPQNTVGPSMLTQQPPILIKYITV